MQKRAPKLAPFSLNIMFYSTFGRAQVSLALISLLQHLAGLAIGSANDVDAATHVVKLNCRCLCCLFFLSFSSSI